ncbi:flavodoxin family protein [Wukongibacter baidiensis]|uniref:flavodoxin family protein n=1 Tax=Wukongibacter baidiensis TaxID=1723361 RepID=UPI003D7FD98A
MKILSVLGSPNKNGNTGVLLEEYLKGIKENHSDIEIKNIFLQDKKTSGCRGCDACKSGKIDGCIIQDDMNEMYGDIEASEVIVFATPIYFFSMTAQLKSFIDRMYALDSQAWRGKKIVLLTTYGGEDEVSSGAINLVNIMKNITDYAGIEFIQKYGVSTADYPTSKNEKALKEVYDLGKEL